MLALWMVYATAVGALVIGAAAVVDRRTAFAGRGRWVWGLALIAALAIPVVRPQLVLRAPGAVSLGEPVVVSAPSEAIAPHAPSLVQRAEVVLAGWSDPLAGAWGGATAVLLALLIGSALALRRKQRRWPTATLDGRPVLISEGLGPALVGLVHPEIVVPPWVLDLDPTERALILRHEEEHRHRRDPLLLAAGVLAPVLFPWSPAVWWGFSRLRHAVEADCDRRVLAAGLGSPVRYARLLLDVGSRVVGIVPVSAGFGENSSSLERRVRAMLDSRIVGGVKGAVVRGTVAAVLLLAACLVTNPTAPVVPTSSGDGAATPVSPTDTSGTGVQKGPTFTPYTVRPRVLNKETVVREMQGAYPPLLRDAGIGGTAIVYFFVDANGNVEQTKIFKSAGRPQLDSAALKVARTYRFSPAMNRDRKVAVWVQFPITFQAPGATGAKALPLAPRTHTPVEAKPTFTPYTVAPKIQNRMDVIKAMERDYPAALRNAGIGGTVVVSVFVGTDGKVHNSSVRTGSGHPALDAAALKVTRAYLFSPAMNKDKKVAVWIQFPITFDVH